MSFLSGRIHLPRDDGEMRVPGGKRNYEPQTITGGFPPEAVERLRNTTSTRRGQLATPPAKASVVTGIVEESAASVTTSKRGRKAKMQTVAPEVNGVGGTTQNEKTAPFDGLTDERARNLYYGLYIGESRSAAYCANRSGLELSSLALITRWLAMGLRIRNVPEAEAAERQEGEYWEWPVTVANPPADVEMETAPVVPAGAAESPSPPRKLRPHSRPRKRKVSDDQIERTYQELYIGKSLSAAECAATLNISGGTFSDHCGRLNLKMRDIWQTREATQQKGQPWVWPEDGVGGVSMVTAGGRIVEESVTMPATPPAPMVTALELNDPILVTMPPDAPAPMMELDEAAAWFRQVYGRVRAMREELAGIEGVAVNGRVSLVCKLEIEIEQGGVK